LLAAALPGRGTSQATVSASKAQAAMIRRRATAVMVAFMKSAGFAEPWQPPSIRVGERGPQP